MKLSQLLEGTQLTGGAFDPDCEITALATDSAGVVPGCAFICIRGTRRDGHDYVEKAIDDGAVFVVAETPLNCAAPPCGAVTVKDSRSAAATLWSRWYGMPDRSMKIAAVTGTNGKTSTAYALYGILRRENLSTGMIGTVDCVINGELLPHGSGSELYDMPAAMTTPDPGQLYKLLYAIKSAGGKYAVLEASSHALHQKRLDGMHADVGIFTNLSPEHLDYHGSMEEYFRCKSSLAEKCSACVINTDDEWFCRLADSDVGSGALRCSASGDNNADMLADNVRLLDSGICFTLRFGGKTAEVFYPAWGRFSVYNGMLAVAAAVQLGMPFENAAANLAYVSGAPGRMERILLPGANFKLYIDYAHTPAALAALLSTVREFTPAGGRLTVLFGCGGDRDKSKRPAMGRIAAELADRVIVTSDNCRTENRDEIISDILAGIPSESDCAVIPDRRLAIGFAVGGAEAGDVIVLAGKGHENYEIDGEGKHPFDEREIVREAYFSRREK